MFGKFNKKAVILTNHYRSLELNWEHIKRAYGPNTDYYITTYNHNFRYETLEESNNRHNSSNPYKYSYSKIESDYLTFINEFIKPVNYNVVTLEELYQFTGKLNISHHYSNIEQSSIRIGNLWCKYKAFNLLKERLFDYDLIIFNRCDMLPSLNENYPLELKDNCVYSDKIELYNGMVSIKDSLFYGNPNSIYTVFNSFEGNLLKLFKEIEYFYLQPNKLQFEALFGSLLQILNINTKTTLSIQSSKLFKPN